MKILTQMGEYSCKFPLKVNGALSTADKKE